MQTIRPASRLTRVASAVGLLCAGAVAHGQQAPAPAAAGTQTITVTGIRQSLETSLNLKREAQGLVDGIVAEDIGKFPDTNLAESMQRIAGVSIDRSNGEGSKVTVRGVGPDFNLVLLNGRQMPATSLLATTASNSRSFDFANLATEGVAALEVYKTSRADAPTGGIGATINIRTTRPLDARRRVVSFGAKAVKDESNSRLPDMLQGDSLTPEVSGIYSDVFADGSFGISITGSHQKRSSGFNQAAVDAGWRTFRGDESNWGTIPLPGQPGSADIVNRPKADDLYVVPQELRYSLNGVQRTRTNGQLVLQYRPLQNVTATLDHTYSELKVHTRRSELSAWFNFGPSKSSWTDGPIAAPNNYTEFHDNPADVAMAGAVYGTKSRLQSTGLNLNWKVNDRLRLDLDAHRSVSTSGADSPYGTSVSLGASMYNRAVTSADFSNPFPVLGITLSGNPADGASLMQVTGSTFRNSYMRNQIEQAQLKGRWDLNDSSVLDFGVSLTDVRNRTAFVNVQQNDWGGHNSPEAYPDSLWQPAQLVPHFSRALGSANAAAMFNNFYLWNFEAVRQAAITADGSDKWFKPSNDFTDDRSTQERSHSAFVQLRTDWTLGVPMSAAAGVRYEATRVNSQARVPIATGIKWVSANEYEIVYGDPGTTRLSGKYDFVLPSIDWEASLRNNLKLRASYGESIGRPDWGSIQGGRTLNEFRFDGGAATQGNPALQPLHARNFDLSLEFYYARSSYAAIGLFQKNIKNFIGTSSVQDTPFNLTTPINGPLFNEAVSTSCPTKDLMCIRNYILNTYNGTRGVVKTGVDGNGNALGTIAGQPGDPAATFTVTMPSNQRNDRIRGVELNLQHSFGLSGFGVSANYTLVRSGLRYDDRNLQTQYALVGLSDSANLVAFYENKDFGVRLAYNWRDKFLSSTTADVFGSAGPAYTEAYGQFDLSMSYRATPRLSFQLEAINLNDGVQRVHGRTKQEVLFMTQTGRRYAAGMRYTF